MRTSHKIGLGLLAAVGLGGFLVGRSGTSSGSTPAVEPPILRRVQALGQLHTARYTYQNVFEHTTYREPNDWAQLMPGMVSLVRSSTTNTALIEATAEVEAGVDLSRARLVRRVGCLPELILPHAIVYRPQLDAVVRDATRGLFWRDDNIALAAVADAQIKLRQAANRQGIVALAERNAVTQVQRVIPSEVTVSFE